MKIETFTCDKCHKMITKESNFEAYVLEHKSLVGTPIMGDNRVPPFGFHFCRSCFGEIYYLAINPKT